MARGTSQCRAPPPGPPPPRTKRTNLRRTGRWTSRLARAVLAFVSGFPPGTVSRGGSWMVVLILGPFLRSCPSGRRAGVVKVEPPAATKERRRNDLDNPEHRRRIGGGGTDITQSSATGAATRAHPEPAGRLTTMQRWLTQQRNAGPPRAAYAAGVTNKPPAARTNQRGQISTAARGSDLDRC